MRKIIYILMCFLIINSCKKEDITECKLISGKTTIEYRSLENFKNILLKDNVNLILEKSDTSYLTIETGENLQKGIKTDVSDNGWLRIENKNGCDWARDYDIQIDVHLYYTDIDTIEYRSIGDITSVDSLTTDSLWIHVFEGAGIIKPTINVERLYCQLHYGTLDIVIDGKCGMAIVYTASYGLMDLRNLNSKIVFVNSRSSNNTFVNAYNTLGAEIGNIGDIYYKGNPESLILNKTGTGNLIKLDN